MFNGGKYKESLKFYEIITFPFMLLFAIVMGVFFGAVIGLCVYVSIVVVSLNMLKDYLMEKLCS